MYICIYICTFICIYICIYARWICGKACLHIGTRHCAAACFWEVPTSCTDLDPTLFYISTLKTYSTFTRENEMLALDVWFPQPCSSAARRLQVCCVKITLAIILLTHWFVSAKMNSEVLCTLDSNECTSRTVSFARHADERNMGCVYDHRRCSSIKKTILYIGAMKAITDPFPQSSCLRALRTSRFCLVAKVRGTWDVCMITKGDFQSKTNLIYRGHASHTGSFLSRSCSTYKAN